MSSQLWPQNDIDKIASSIYVALMWQNGPFTVKYCGVNISPFDI